MTIYGPDGKPVSSPAPIAVPGVNRLKDLTPGRPLFKKTNAVEDCPTPEALHAYLMECAKAYLKQRYPHFKKARYHAMFIKAALELARREDFKQQVAKATEVMVPA